MAAESTAAAEHAGPTAGEYIGHHLTHLRSAEQHTIADFSVVNWDSVFWSVLLGVPLPIWGLAGFLAIGLLAWRPLQAKNHRLLRWIALFVTIGITVAAAVGLLAYSLQRD